MPNRAEISNAESMFCYLLRTMRQRIEYSSMPAARKRTLASELSDFLVPAVIASRSTLEVVQMIASRFSMNLVGDGWIGGAGTPVFNRPAMVTIPAKFLPLDVAKQHGPLATKDEGAPDSGGSDGVDGGGEGEVPTDLMVSHIRWDKLTRLIPFHGLRIAVHTNPTLFSTFAMSAPITAEEEMFQPWQEPAEMPKGVHIELPKNLLAPRAYRALWTLTSPMAHGADQKNGNVSLFRRQRVIDPTTNEEFLVPFVSGNAVRGLWRDQMMHSMLARVWLTAHDVAARTAHTLLAGGTIEQGADTSTVDTYVRRQARHLLPAWNLLGGVMRQQIMRGILRVSDTILLCRENAWLIHSMLKPTDPSGAPLTLPSLRAALKPADDLTQLRLLTRHAHRDFADADGMQMITNTEVLLQGTTMVHSFHVLAESGISSLALSCMAHTIREFADHPYVGAGAARSLGQVAFDQYTTDDGTPLPSPNEYLDFLATHSDEIRAFLLGTEGAKAAELTKEVNAKSNGKGRKGGKGKVGEEAQTP